MNEVITLIKGDARRDVFCRLQSIGQSEFYEASARDFYPEMKFVLADYLDYDNEQLIDYNGRRFRVLRTYRAGQELELTVSRADAEDGGVYE